ncbi:hypothetical protein M0R45_005673 [Rubus argutus]|uniref:Uncharacterized protein n=1 Tax=Rubus argutus TaxID=59490 RepID=A0AAW1YNA4_RUBAR
MALTVLRRRISLLRSKCAPMYPNRHRKAQLCCTAAVAANHTRAQRVRSDLLHHRQTQLATLALTATVPLSRCTHHHLTASPPARALAGMARKLELEAEVGRLSLIFLPKNYMDSKGLLHQLPFLFMILVSLSLMSMVIFACGRGGNKEKSKKKKRSGSGCGSGSYAGGGCAGGGCVGGCGGCGG